MAFIELTVSNMLVLHGYDLNNIEMMESVDGQQPAKKVVAISRIQSLTEKYVLVSSGYGRFMYWEYHDGYNVIKDRLRTAGLFIE